MIRSVGRQVLASRERSWAAWLFWKDANHNTAQTRCRHSVEDMEQREEEELLALVKSWMATLPAPDLDILILDEIGKNISGAGMDTKVVNRSVHGEYNPWPNTPRIQRIYVRDLSELTL